VDRRKFLKGTAVVAGAAALSGVPLLRKGATALAQPPPPFRFILSTVAIGGATSKAFNPMTATAAGDSLSLVAETNGTAQYATSVTDSKGNTWVQAFTPYHAISPSHAVFYTTGTTAALATTDTVTVHLNASSTLNLKVEATDAPGVGAFDQVSGPVIIASGALGSVNITPAVANETLIAYGSVGAGATGAPTWSSPVVGLGSSSGSGPWINAGYEVLSGGGGVQQTLTDDWPGTAAARLSVLAYKPVSAPTLKVVRTGDHFTVDGVTTRLNGFNMWPMAIAAGFGHPPNYPGSNVTNFDSQLTHILATAPHVNTIRTFFLQQFTLNNGVRDWSAFDQCLSVADSHGVRLVVSLEDNWNYERTGGGHTPDLGTLGFWTSGSNGYYADHALPSQTEPYRAWVQEVVTRYAGDHRIALWELVNEGNGMTVAFATDMGAVIKGIDPTTPIEVGGVGTNSGIITLANIDCGSYHYYTDFGQTGWGSEQSACATAGKPWLMGEMGNSGSGTTRSNAINTLEGQIFADSNTGGFVYWQYSEFGGDQFKITSNTDPALPVIDSYHQP